MIDVEEVLPMITLHPLFLEKVILLGERGEGLVVLVVVRRT